MVVAALSGATSGACSGSPAPWGGGGSSGGSGSGSSGGSSGTTSGSSGTSGGSGSSSGGGSGTSSSGTTGSGSSSGGGSGSGSGSGSSSGGSTSGAFRHPGVLLNGDQIAFLKAQIAASAAPWTAALQRAKTAVPPSYLGTVPFASLTYVPQPVPEICCGSHTSPDVGCRAEQFDVVAAYTDALIWALTGDESYAKQAVVILNAYGSVLQTHAPPTSMCGSPPGVSSNTPVESGWCGSIFPRAAEIMRTYSGWAQADIDKFKAMLRTAYIPNLINGAPGENGNWELSMADALIQIGVFLDDTATYNQGLAYWRRRVPAYIYLTSDGSTPVTFPMEGATWNGATSYFNGLSQETCRDLGHVQLGFAGMINGAETARIQGVDLYSEQSTRIVAGLELAASYLNGATTPDPGCPYNSAKAMGFPNPPLNKPNPMWEIAYNQYATRAMMTLPNTAALIAKIRPTAVDHEMAWETLTHAEVGSVGLQ